jgi:hypothetical protein
MSLGAADYLAQLPHLGRPGQWAYDRLIALTIENTQLRQQNQQKDAALQQAQATVQRLEEGKDYLDVIGTTTRKNGKTNKKPRQTLHRKPRRTTLPSTSSVSPGTPMTKQARRMQPGNVKALLKYRVPRVLPDGSMPNGRSGIGFNSIIR